MITLAWTDTLNEKPAPAPLTLELMTRLPVPAAALLLAFAAQAAPLDLSGLSRKLQEFKLANGFTVAVLERKNAPVVSAALVVRAGYAFDPPGKRGLAVLFEELLEEGPEARASRGLAAEKTALQESEAATDRWEALRRKGAGDSAEGQRALVDAKFARERAATMSFPRFTRRALEQNFADGFQISVGPDQTLVTARLPSARVESFFLLFGEWMRNPLIRNFYFHRDARAKRLSAAPPSADQQFLSAVLRKAFPDHPYGLPPAVASEMERLRAHDAQEFAQRHYTVNNAGLVLVGDIGVAEARRLAELYFGQAVAGGTPPSLAEAIPAAGHIPPPPEAPMAMAVFYPNPPDSSPDDVVVDRIAIALTSGPKSRARKVLVEKERSPGFVPLLSVPGGSKGGLTGLAVPARPGRAQSSFSESMSGLYESLGESGFDQSELDESAAALHRGTLDSISDPNQVAALLARNLGAYGSAMALIQTLGRLDAVTPDDVRRVAKKYFTPERRLTVSPFMPAGGRAPGAAQ